MVLLVGGEDKGIQDLAAGYGGIVAQVRVDKPGPIFQLGMGGHDKTDGFHAIEYATAITYDAIHQLAAFPDLGLGLGGGVDGDVLYFIGAFQVGVAAYPYVLDDLTILDNGAIPDLSVITSPVIKDLFREFL